MANRATREGPKAPTWKVADFDEQLWPVNCAIIVLAGFLVGIICAQGNFNSAEATFFENAYVHLGIVALLVGTLVWAVTWLHGRIVRRVQLSILFSLLVHLGLAIYLHGQYLALVAQEDFQERPEVAESEERITVPDYPWQYPDQPRRVESFERPVPTEVSEPLPSEPVERHPTEQEATLQRPAPIAPEPHAPSPEPAKIDRAKLVPPEREQAAEQVRRRQPDHRPEPEAFVAPPEIPPTVATQPPPRIELESRPAVVRRRLELPGTARPAAQPTPFQPEPTPSPLSRRPFPSQEHPPRIELSPTEPVSLAKADTGGDLPSAAVLVEEVTAPAARGGAAPSSLEITSLTAAVERSNDLAFRRANTSAVGTAEFALGSSQIVARVGQPRMVGQSVPSVGPNDPARRIARAPIGGPVPTIATPELAQVAAQAAAFGGGPPTAPPDARGTPVGRAGSVGIPVPVRIAATGLGLPDSRGMSGQVAAAPLARVTGEGSVSAAAAGGGVPLPVRRFGRAVASDVTVEVPQPAAGLASGGVFAGPSVEAQPSGQDLHVVGLPGSLPTRPRPGAIGSLASVGPRLPTAVARRAFGGQETPGRVGTSPANPATLVKANAAPKLPAAVVPLENVFVAGAGGTEAARGGQPSLLEMDPNALLQPAASGPASSPPLESEADRLAAPGGLRRPGLQVGALPLRLAPSLSPSDLRSELALAPGALSRRVPPESEVAFVPRASVSMRIGSRPVIDGRVRQPPAQAFQQRAPDRRAELARQHGATEGSEEAVEQGLDFLARHQFPDGHWSLDRLPHTDQAGYADAALGQMRADTAATGLALLAFLGAGYTHLDNKHRAVVEKGIGWLVANQQPNGQLFTIPTDTDRPARSYGHAIAAIALCEAYGMTGDAALRQPAARAIQYIVDTQHPTLGGWRYTPADDEATWRRESDTSVSGWMLMALKSAQMAGLDFPPEVMRNVGQWLDRAQTAGGSQYVYNPYAGTSPEQRRGRVPNRAMTAEGLLMRLYLGWDRSHPAMISGADFLRANLPEMGPRDGSIRDVYYWYYATQVMFQMQGDHWTAWNDRMRPLLKQSQVQDGPLAGSWHPQRPVPDRWSHAGGRLYVTTLNLLMLEVYYRYLPLFKTLIDEAVSSR